MKKLIDTFQCQLAEAACLPGSGIFTAQVIVPDTITEAFPYLNAVLDDTWYDHENKVLIGILNERRCAFRSGEILISGIYDSAEVPEIVSDIIAEVNRIWEKKEDIAPSFVERAVPTVMDIYKCLPKTNCRQCGQPTCLVFAAQLRDGLVSIEQCTPLSDPQYGDNRMQVLSLFRS